VIDKERTVSVIVTTNCGVTRFWCPVRILGFRRAPLVVGRNVNVRTEIKPVATDQLLGTFLMQGEALRLQSARDQDMTRLILFADGVTVGLIKCHTQKKLKNLC